MHITQEQIAGETRIDSNTSLVQDLKTKHGVIDPQIILVFDSDEKVHVFYNSPTECKTVNLNVPTVINTKVWPQGEEVIKVIYPGGGMGFCKLPKILGKPPKWVPGP